MIVAIIAVAVVVVFLLLVVLALMREIVILRSEVATVSTLVKNPPPPSFVGAQAPDALRRVLAAELPGDSGSGQQLVAFVTPSCGPCENLVAGIDAAIAEDQISRDDVLFLIWALPQSGWEQWSGHLPARAVPDIDGRLARVCEVRGTPAIFVVSRASWVVLDYNMKGDAEWAVSRLSEPATQPPTSAAA